VEPARDPNPIAPAMLEATGSLGIPTFDQNGEMMESEGGAAIPNLRIYAGGCLPSDPMHTPIWIAATSQGSPARW
jgi:hypothetical protein